MSLLALFAAVQLADGIMTFAGVESFGPSAEGNPVLFFYITTFGAGATLVGAKSLAIALATTLHLRAHHLALVVLTVVYVLAAIGPWALLAG